MITKEGLELAKTAARWHDMFVNLSPEAKRRILIRGGAEGWVKSYDDIINGINRGTDNILGRLGYTEVNASGATPKQLKKIRRKAGRNLMKSMDSADDFGMRRNLDTISFANRGEGANPFSDGSSGWTGAGSVPAIKAIFTKNIRGGKYSGQYSLNRLIQNPAGEIEPMANAILRRHEAYESQAAEQGLSNVFNKGKASRDRLTNINRAIDTQLKDPAVDAVTKQVLLWNKDINKHHGKLLQWGSEAQDNMSGLASLGVKNQGIIKDHALSSANTVGAHYDSNVITKERKLLDRIPHINRAGTKAFRELRNKVTKEYGLMDTLGGYTPSVGNSRFSTKNARKMNVHRNQAYPVPNSKGTTTSMLLEDLYKSTS